MIKSLIARATQNRGALISGQLKLMLVYVGVLILPDIYARNTVCIFHCGLAMKQLPVPDSNVNTYSLVSGMFLQGNRGRGRGRGTGNGDGE